MFLYASCTVPFSKLFCHSAKLLLRVLFAVIIALRALLLVNIGHAAPDGTRPRSPLGVRALVRRRQQPILPHRMTVGPLDVDTRSRQALVHGRPVPLTTKEYALLEYLVRRHGEVVSRAEIAEHVWDEHYDPLSNIIDVYVQRLRRKLDVAGCESLIRTRRGEGYQLVGSDR